MAKLGALAPDPIGFTDTSGKQIFIPTSLVYFEDGVVKFTAPAGMTPATTDAVGKWLAALAKDGVIAPAAAATPAPAMVISAKDAGAAGNTIQIAISNVRPKPGDATKTIFDATVTETNVHTLLTPATLKATVGDAAGGGESPGLVFVSSAGAPVQPKNGEYPLAGDPAEVDVQKANGTAGGFELTAKAAGAEGANTKAIVSKADDAAQPGTFTLEVEWTKSVAGIEAAELQASFAYEITVAAPQGGALAAPAAGTYVLAGGAEPKEAAKAEVTIPAGS
jgi:hypothetical protein